MKSYAIIAAFFAQLLSQAVAFFRGGQSQRRKDKIRGLQDKVTANEIEDELEDSSANDDIAALSRVRRDK